MKNTRRGWNEEDERFFGEEGMKKISRCSYEAAFLLERGYPLESTVTYTANHRMLSARQRIAMGRLTVCPSRLKWRKEKELKELEQGCTVNVDALNAVILMETALSRSVLLRCMDGCIRDLSGLRGTYSIIENTGPAIDRILGKLKEKGVEKAVFWMDEPVSNSGRLKTCILDHAEKLSFPVEVQMVKDVDTQLKKRDHVISADSLVIEECLSWYNLYAELIKEVPDAWVVQVDEKEAKKGDF